MDKSYQTKSPSTTPPVRDIDFDSIPNELKQRTRWVNWQYRKRRGKLTKVPLNPRTAREASCDDSATWGTLHQALATLSRGKLDGIGFQFGPPYVGIDFDKCRNAETGVIEPWAEGIIEKLNSYTEISPSGTGIHIIAKGGLPPGPRRKGNVEMYSEGRYFTVTGRHLEDTSCTIEERSREINTLHQQVFSEAHRRSKTSRRTGSVVNVETDGELIERARRVANGAKFERLWSGDWSGYDSQSEADSALCMMLAFWTGRDTVRIDGLFRRSRLFRDKWDEQHGADGRTYGQITTDKAIEQTSEVYAPRGRGGEKISLEAGDGAQHLPVIVVNHRQLRNVTADALKALVAANESPVFFVRGAKLARVRRDENQVPIIDTVGEYELRARLARVANYVRSKTNGGLVDCPPTPDLSRDFLALGEWNLPPLEEIAEVPVLRPDGTVLDQPAYDPSPLYS